MCLSFLITLLFISHLSLLFFSCEDPSLASRNDRSSHMAVAILQVSRRIPRLPNVKFHRQGMNKKHFNPVIDTMVIIRKVNLFVVQSFKLIKTRFFLH